jgi:hypothetical protein
MAHWIASNDRHFGGIADFSQMSMPEARRRAERAWSALDLHGGWDSSALSRESATLIRSRFGYDANPAQRGVIAAAEAMERPGLLIVEAPMGEGKTEAAMAAAEVLARCFGADGIFVGMPTQATSDPMLTRVQRWLATMGVDVPVALLHGRSRFNREWAQLQRRVRFRGVSDEFDMDDPYGAAVDGDACCSAGGFAAAEWYLGRNRGLLTPVAIGTVDQLLHAATRTRHVMLRSAWRASAASASPPRLIHGVGGHRERDGGAARRAMLRLSRQPVAERVLWRLDVGVRHRAELLVLTDSRPSWEHSAEQAGWPQADEPQQQVRDYQPLLEKIQRGREFRLRLRANPVSSTRTPLKPSAAQEKRLAAERPRGVRVAHRTAAHQLAWFAIDCPGGDSRHP